MPAGRIVRLKRAVPWPAKLALKLVLARLPIPYAAWKRLSLFEHGAMEDPGYVLEVIRRHIDRSGMPPGRTGFTCLELGPGDSLASALVMPALGAGRTYLVDVEPFADRDVSTYKELAGEFRRSGLAVPDVSAATTVDDVLRCCNATYLTDGLSSLRELATGTVDLVWSHAVLEHVRRSQVPLILGELRRISSADSVSSHRIDLRDHLSSALNNLRFSDAIWESKIFATSGFYTNRLRFFEMVELFRAAGFEVLATDVNRWPALPTPRSSMAEPFRQHSDDELRISGFDVVLRPSMSARDHNGAPISR